MRDIGAATLAAVTTLLAVYIAGLIFVAQHIADRYSPLIYPRVIRSVAGRWLAALAVLVLAALLIVLLPERGWTNDVDGGLIVTALAVSMTGLYSTFSMAADRRRIIGMAHTLASRDERATALRDMTWHAINRGDVTAAELLLAPGAGGLADQARLLEWVTEYSGALEQSWLRTLVLRSALEPGLEDDAADLLRSVLERLLVSCLDHRWYDSAEELVLAVIAAVAGASRFGEHHSYLLFDLGFALYCVGEEGRASPRVGDPEVALGRLQEWYSAKLTTLRRAVVRHRDAASVEHFCQLLHRLVMSDIATDMAVAQVYDVVEDSYPHGAVSIDALDDLASTIGAARGSQRAGSGDGLLDSPEFYHQTLNERACHLALYAVAIGHVDQVSRMMGNARLFPLRRMPQRLAMHNALGEDVYAAVARELGCRRWPR